MASVDQRERSVTMEQNTQIAFLGTGAADWHDKTPNGEWRTFASVLVDGHILWTAPHASLIRWLKWV